MSLEVLQLHHHLPLERRDGTPQREDHHTVSKHQANIRRERALELGLELAIGLPVLVAGTLYGVPWGEGDVNLEALGYYDDLAPEVARLKGEINAVSRTMALKICQATPPSAPASQ